MGWGPCSRHLRAWLFGRHQAEPQLQGPQRWPEPRGRRRDLSCGVSDQVEVPLAPGIKSRFRRQGVAEFHSCSQPCQVVEAGISWDVVAPEMH